MTMTPQPTLEVPAKIAAGIAAGIFRRDGGVIRWADSGRIYTFLKDAAPRTEASEQAMGRATAVLKSRGTLVVSAVVVTTALAAGAYTYLKKRRGEADVPRAVANLNVSLRTYLDAAQSGTLDAAIISKLITHLDAVTEHQDTDGVPFDFSSELWESLVALIVDHTQKLAEAFSVDLSDLEQDAPAEGNPSVIDLRRHLEAQRQIFSSAA